MKKIIYWSWY